MTDLIFAKISSTATLILLVVLAQFNGGYAQTNNIRIENLAHKSPGQYTTADWAALIDSRWGAGLPTADKLVIFDIFWTDITSNFSAFHNLQANVDSLHDLFRAEVEGGVSRGRFAAIMNHFTLAFNDAHTFIYDIPVNFSALQPGTPLLVMGGNLTAHFGAAVTPLPDSTLVVYNVRNNHPIGLEPGDVLLGYDGVLWKDIQENLLEAQLPLILNHYVGSTDESTTHLTQVAAGLNWHLFDTIDILKYSTGETLHFPTSDLSGQTVNIFAGESMPIPGVAWANPVDGDYISWGIVEGTNFGYIYSTAWSDAPALNIANLFRDAVDSLMHRYDTDGIIFDYRMNLGGSDEAEFGYELLFNTDVETIGYDVRDSNSSDRFAMVPHPAFDVALLTLNGDPATFYDKPIAVLQGPGALSAGDIEALRIRFHPTTRTFGKPTNGAFTLLGFPSLGDPDWFYKRASGTAYLASDHSYLDHTAVPVDEEIWLQVDDVANGEDTVVKRAMEWMNNLVYSHGANVTNKSALAGPDTITLVTKIHNSNSHSLIVYASLESESLTIDSVGLFDDGLHGDGSAGDDLWGADFLAPSVESHFKVNIETIDTESSISRVLPIATRLTTIGPLEYESHIILSKTYPNPGDDVTFKLSISNKGSSARGNDLNVELSSIDSCVTSIKELGLNKYNDIKAGDIFESPHGYELSLNESCSGMEDVRVDIVVLSERFPYWTDSFNIQVFPVGVDEERVILPYNNILSNAHPNPFNPITTIEYELAEPGEVQLMIYNLLGQEVEKLVDGRRTAGKHQIIWNASQYSSGIYFYRIVTEEFSKTRKMILLK